MGGGGVTAGVFRPTAMFGLPPLSLGNGSRIPLP